MKEIKITDIDRIKIGNAENLIAGTGCTVIICEEGGVAGVDVRGGGPASHETELLNPVNTVTHIHGITLSGGSAYGLEASHGVMKYLEEKGIGFKIGNAVVPIVCGASLFDLTIGDGSVRPDKNMGYEASLNSEKNIITEGNFGAGTGAVVGKFKGINRGMKGGLGCFAVQVGDLKVGAIVAVNARGDVFDIETNTILAGILSEDKSTILNTEKLIIEEYQNLSENSSGNTTIGCIITNGKLTKSQATKVASMGHNGYAKSINPVHTSLDGDTIFTLSTGEIEAHIDLIGTLGSYVISKAVVSAIKNAKPAYGLKAYCDFF